MNLAPGDELYYIEEIDPPNERLHTWRLVSRRVRQVHKNGFFFDQPVGFRNLHRFHRIGTYFHHTREAAIAAFVAWQHEKIATAQREIAEAERAIAWGAPAGRSNGALP